MDGDTAVVGISDHAQSELGDVVYVELPDVGTDLEKDKTFGVVESVKTASDVYSPVSGQVVEINEKLKSAPELARLLRPKPLDWWDIREINEGAFTVGWMLKVKPSNTAELDTLHDAASYKKLCGSE